jgi:3-polyprenyl-4-hydroxybenzoate decarboxylase
MNNVLSQLPGLFNQMAGDTGAKLMENLMNFTSSINMMNENQLIAFHQALALFAESQPKGSIFARTKQYKMIKKVQNISEAKMKQMINDAGYGGYRATLIHNFEKAVPGIGW